MDESSASLALAGLVQLAKSKAMGRDRPNTSAASDGPSKKPRKENITPSSEGGSRLLQSNRYSVLMEDNGSGDAIMKKERVPPLFTPVKDLKALQAAFEKHGCRPCFKLCGVGTKIVCFSFEEYAIIGAMLKEGKVEFYTHDIPSAKPLKVVLR